MMSVWYAAFLIINFWLRPGSAMERGLTPLYFPKMDEIQNLAEFNDAEHRGQDWYDWSSNTDESSSDLKSNLDTASSSISDDTETYSSKSSSSEASSMETKERRRATQVYRTCIPCPQDMLKQHNNIGIKWICGGYQRARRSFKSPCMMRYRNCQDGTMFVKLYDHRCKNDSYHGRHWFYIYKV